MGTHQYKCCVSIFLDHVTETAEGVMDREGKRNDFRRMPHVEFGKKEANGRMW